jgi:hypothetical protein
MLILDNAVILSGEVMQEAMTKITCGTTVVDGHPLNVLIIFLPT